jgi:transposase-like protein
LPQLKLDFSVDRVILSAKGGSKMTRVRRTFTAQEKAAIVLRHLVDKTPVSDLADEFGLQPTQIYAWQKQLATNAALAFEPTRLSTKQNDAKDRKIQALEAKIQQKNEVVAELLQEHVQLKKALGEP